MPKIVIKATRYSRTPEADEIFEQRGWRPVFDQSIIPSKRRIVDKGSRNTPLIDLNWEELEYD
jgi:hypothetical protein